MKKKINYLFPRIEYISILTILFTFLLVGCYSPFKNISKHVLFMKGYVNGVQIRNKGKKLIIYGDPSDRVKAIIL